MKLVLEAIVTFSGIAIGGAGYLVLVHFHDMICGEDRLLAVAFAAARAGFCIMIGLVAAAVARLGRVDTSDWRTWAYLVGAVLAGSGYLVLAIRGFIRRGKDSM